VTVARRDRLLAVGLSYKTATIQDRERTALDDRHARAVLRARSREPAVSEAVALSTCNRTELYAVVQDHGVGEVALRRALLEHARLAQRRLECALSTFREDDTVAHLFRVAAGLDSMVVGESEIQGQVRAAADRAAHFAGRGVGFDSLGEELRAADIVISSTDAPHRILRRDDIEAVMASREGRRLVVIDIAVPRDVEASVKAVPGVTLYDIDDLEQVAEANLNGRRCEAERAEQIIVDELSHFREWQRAITTARTSERSGRGRRPSVSESSPSSTGRQAHCPRRPAGNSTP
jgi:glutamyl-tRNA reductase